MTARQAEKEVQRQAMLFEDKCLKGQITANVKFEDFAEQWFEEYPFVFDRMHFDTARRMLYIFDECHCNKKGNAETAKILTEEHGITPQDMITADSAEPKSIGDYRSYGLFCRATEKGAGSVEYSMKWLQSLCGIVIDGKRCPETAKEFLRYEYERSKDGEIISGYPDEDNHHIDAVRYGMSPVWRK